MNLREAIGEYVVGYLQCHEVIGMEGEGADRIRRQFGEAEDRLYRIVEVAEAALAYAEYRADADRDAVNQLVCAAEHWRLWDAFWVARAKAREVNREST